MRAYVIGILVGLIMGFAIAPSQALEPSYGGDTTYIGDVGVTGDVDVTGNISATGDMSADEVTANTFTGGIFNGAFIGDATNLVNIPDGATTITFFLTNTLSSDLGGSSYRELTQDVSELGDDKYLTNTVTTSSAFIYNAVSKVSEPAVTFIEGGVYSLHYHAYKTGGKTVAMYYKIGVYNGSTVEYLGTSSSAYLEITESDFDSPISIPDTTLDATDRIVLSIFVSVSGVGANPDVILEVEGDSLSHFNIGGPSVSASTFLPYAGAIKNVISTHGAQFDNLAITPYYAGTISNSYTVDFANGGVQTMTLTNTVATRFAFTNTVDGGLYSLILTQPSLANATTFWPDEVKWRYGTAPTITNSNGAVDMIQLIVVNSSVILGSHVANMQ
jgi:hypothetical protein